MASRFEIDIPNQGVRYRVCTVQFGAANCPDRKKYLNCIIGSHNMEIGPWLIMASSEIL